MNLLRGLDSRRALRYGRVRGRGRKLILKTFGTRGLRRKGWGTGDLHWEQRLRKQRKKSDLIRLSSALVWN